MFSSSCPFHSPQPATPPPPFRFRDLPPEIRNHIATIVLTSDEPIQIRQPKFNRHPEPTFEPMFPSHPRLDFPLPRTPPPSPPGEDATSHQLCGSSRARDGHSRLAFLMTCKQIHAEHWATYYSSNRFFFTPSTWPAFNASIPQRCRHQLRHVRIRMPYRHRFLQVWRALGELPQLTTVDVILAPPGNATKLERINCVQGVRFCEQLRRVRIEREGIGEGEGPLADEKEKAELLADKKVEKSINRDLASQWRQRKRQQQQRQDSSGGALARKDDSVGDFDRSPAGERKLRRDEATPSESAMDAYFSMVEDRYVGQEGT